MEGWKNNNDPWVPLPSTNGDCSNPRLSPQSSITSDTGNESSSSNAILLQEAPSNPLYHMMDSQQYIEKLENKLQRLKSSKREPTSKDIITSLALFQEDQMKRFVNAETNIRSEDACVSDESIASSSFITRKLHPELQALSAEELIELIRSDVIADSHDEDSPLQDQITASPHQSQGAATSEPLNNLSHKSSESEGWANFEEMNQVINSE